MGVTTKGRYALRVMLDLARHGSEGKNIALREVAERQEISLKYLEAIVSVLRTAGFVAGARGQGGGYRLTRRPEEYTVGAILRQIEGNLSPVACLQPGGPVCKRAPSCPTRTLWEELDQVVDSYLEGITLADLLRRQTDPAAEDYQI